MTARKFSSTSRGITLLLGFMLQLSHISRISTTQVVSGAEDMFGTEIGTT
jgi:hypothetical protein